MSLQEHVDSLRAKHARLEQEIDEEQHRPLPDEMTLARLKREKLRLKDAIVRLTQAGERVDAEPSLN